MLDDQRRPATIRVLVGIPTRSASMMLIRAKANLFVALALLWAVAIVANTADADASDNTDDFVIRWASTGGGWRSMVACIGFANLFGQVGLLPTASPTSTQGKSLFSGISTTSGASWFSTQLFYSPQFYDGVIGAANGTDLYDFVVIWMEAYYNVSVKVLQEQQDKISPEFVQRTCNVTALGGGVFIDVLSDLCGTLLYFEGDWAKLVEIMIKATSAAYGDDGLISRKVGSYNRIPEMSDTDLIIQSALVPNSRIRSSDPNEEIDTAVYVGNSHSSGDFLYTVPISAAYVVDDSSSRFAFSAYRESAPFGAFIGSTPSEHSFSELDPFYLYPGTNGSEYVDSGSVLETNDTSKYEFEDPFGADPSVTQIAAISSAAAGAFSPLVPSVFTQGLSEQRHDIVTDDDGISGLRAFERTVKRLYSNSLFDNFAVCSSWPVPCGLKDGYFIDGAYVDNPSLAMNIAQYHRSDNYNRSKTIKVVLTNTNRNADTQYTSILQYFDSPLNEGVRPGDFNWPPKLYVPHQSTQIFQEYMDKTILDRYITQIDGSNMTTAIFKGTTVTNFAYGINSEQKVDVFLINLNQDITTYIVTPTVIKYFTEPLAEMAQHIADNQELKRRLQEFFYLKDDEDSNLGTDDEDDDSLSSPASRLEVHAWLAMQTVLILSHCCMLYK